FTPVAPESVPLMACDVRRAWKGRFPERPDLEVGIEAAAFGGRPVSFQLVGPWTKDARQDTSGLFPLWFVFGLIGLALLLAIRNIRRGRADVRGGLWLCAIFAVSMTLVWVTGGHHVNDLPGESLQVFEVIGDGLVWGLTVFLLYVAMEPA